MFSIHIHTMYIIFPTDLDSRYDTLQETLSKQKDQYKDSLPVRKLFETDLQKIDRWCKDTEMKLAMEPCLDCALQVLEDQYKEYKVDFSIFADVVPIFFSAQD